MALDSPRGLELRGTPTDYVCVPMDVKASSTVYVGDPVKVDSATGNVERVAAGDEYIGVAQTYGASGASALATIQVCIDPNAVYTVQVENGGTFIEKTDLFTGFDVVVPAGPPADIYSDMELEDAAQGPSGQFILIGIDHNGPDPDGSLKPTYGEALVRAIVRPNLLEMASAIQN